MIHRRWKCEQHLNDTNPLVAATWSKPLNNFDHVRNLPASGSSWIFSSSTTFPEPLANGEFSEEESEAIICSTSSCRECLIKRADLSFGHFCDLRLGMFTVGKASDFRFLVIVLVSS
jgi:hypothetical protein